MIPATVRTKTLTVRAQGVGVEFVVAKAHVKLGSQDPDRVHYCGSLDQRNELLGHLGATVSRSEAWHDGPGQEV